MEKELEELNLKIEEILEVFNSDDFLNLPDEEQEVMCTQLDAMMLYHNCLAERMVLKGAK